MKVEYSGESKIVLSEYMEYPYNARVYKANNGEYGVLMYIAEDDFNDVKFFNTEQQAEDFAEEWVMKK